MQGQFFGAFTDVYKSTDYTAAEFDRVFSDGATITLPDSVVNDNGETTQPNDLAVIGVNDATWRYFIYDGAWVETTGLTLASVAPLSSRDQDGLACLLAVRVCETYGQAVTPVIADRADRFVSSLMRFGNMKVEPALRVRQWRW
jgi:hypothetical protein